MEGSLASEPQFSMMAVINREQGHVEIIGVSDYRGAFLILCLTMVNIYVIS